METVSDFILGGSKITADGDCSHEIKRCLLQCSCLENPRDREPGGLPSMESDRVGHSCSDLAAAAYIHIYTHTHTRTHTHTYINKIIGFPGGTSGKESTCQRGRPRRHRFNLWAGKMPWRRKWQPTPVLLPRDFNGQRSLVGYSPWGCKESHMTE